MDSIYSGPRIRSICGNHYPLQSVSSGYSIPNEFAHWAIKMAAER